MSFFDVSSNKKVFEKPVYLALTPGSHQVRLLGNPAKVFIHYIPSQKITLKCLGDDCPICKTNRKIQAENPDNYYKVNGYMGRQPRYLMNVLDRTLVKVCPSCQAENKRGSNNQFQPMCSSCETMIATVEPTRSNKIKILGIAKNNAEILNTLEEGKLDAEGNKIGLNNFDLVIMVTRTSAGKNIPTPMGTDVMDAVEYDETKLYNLETVTLELTESEILEVLKGVSLRDIFLARNPNKNETDATEEVAKSVASVEGAISKLFDA